jgi:hypothetical protein
MRMPCLLGGHRFTDRLSDRITITVRTIDGKWRPRDVEIRQCDRCPKIKVGGFGHIPPYHFPRFPAGGEEAVTMTRRSFLASATLLVPQLPATQLHLAGPWECVHDRGAHACGGVAFYALVKPVTGMIVDPKNFVLPNGKQPQYRDPFICGACGRNIHELTTEDRVFPLSVREKQRRPIIAQPQPARCRP